MKLKPDNGYREMTPTFPPGIRLRRWKRHIAVVVVVVGCTVVFLGMITWPLIAMARR